MLDANRQLTQATPGGMKHRIGNGGGHPCHRNLTQALEAGIVEGEVRLVDEGDLDRADIGIHRHDIFGKIGIEEPAISRIDLARFAQCRADAPYHAASHLAGRSSWTDHSAAIDDAHHPGHADAAGRRLHPDLDEMRDEAECHIVMIDRTTDGWQTGDIRGTKLWHNRHFLSGDGGYQHYLSNVQPQQPLPSYTL